MAQHDDRGEHRSQPGDHESLVHRDRVVQIIAMVKPFRAQAVLAALEAVDVLAGTVREAMGYGRQKDRLHQYLGSEYNSSFVPKVELAVFVREARRAGRDQGDRGPGAHRPDRRRQDPGASVLRRVPELVGSPRSLRRARRNRATRNSRYQWGVLTQRTRRKRGLCLLSSRSTSTCCGTVPGFWARSKA